MERKQLTIKYEAGHSYNTWYEETKLYCPNCGKKNVWMEDDGGDYYVGETYYCLDCECNFTLPSLWTKDESKRDRQTQQVIEGLKS